MASGNQTRSQDVQLNCQKSFLQRQGSGYHISGHADCKCSTALLPWSGQMRAQETQDVPEGSSRDRCWSPDPVTLSGIGNQPSLKGFLDVRLPPSRQHHQRPTGGRRASGSAHLRAMLVPSLQPEETKVWLSLSLGEDWSHQGLEQPGRDADSRCGVRAFALSSPGTGSAWPTRLGTREGEPGTPTSSQLRPLSQPLGCPWSSSPVEHPAFPPWIEGFKLFIKIQRWNGGVWR